MKRLYNARIEPISDATREGYTPHEDFRVEDISTYPDVIYAAYMYQEATGTRCDYPCWIPEAGMVRINPDRMLAYYEKMTA